jgi:hypothetical protein
LGLGISPQKNQRDVDTEQRREVLAAPLSISLIHNDKRVRPTEELFDHSTREHGAGRIVRRGEQDHLRPLACFDQSALVVGVVAGEFEWDGNLPRTDDVQVEGIQGKAWLGTDDDLSRTQDGSNQKGQQLVGPVAYEHAVRPPSIDLRNGGLEGRRVKRRISPPVEASKLDEEAFLRGRGQVEGGFVLIELDGSLGRRRELVSVLPADAR